MINKLKYIAYILLFIFVENNSAQSFTINNVNFLPLHETIHIYYDLVGDKDLSFNVTLRLHRISDTTFVLRPRIISGDYGNNISAGIGKRIIWDIGKEIKGKLKGRDYYFTIKAILE